MNTKKTFPFIGVFAAFMVALASASCMKEVPDMQVVSQPSDAITFGVDDSFRAEVQTKATEVTSLSSFYVTAVTGSAGSESQVWNSVQFSQVPGSFPATYAGNKYWPASNPSYKFYGSNVALNYAAGGTYVNVSNATDVVCAYLSSPTYNTKNTLTFEHIFARLCRVDIVAASGYTLSDISLRITPKTGGTYNLRTKEWSSVATGTATTIASSTGANNNDIFCVPGIYSITASWVARDASGASVTHTNEVCNVPLTGGKTNNISCVLGGDITFGVDLQDYADYDYRDNLNYLTFYCDEAGTIGWKCSNASIARTIQYSKDFGSTWTNLTSTTSGATVSVSAGDIVWFKGNNTEYATSSYYNQFVFSNKVHVYGNVNSLTGNNTSVSAYCFKQLFYNCSNLYTYEHKKIILPATTLATYCYYGMFARCSSLTMAPEELPATTLANYCYANMFQSCTSLTTAPELPATTLAKNCYYYMFYGCTSLTTAPKLPATTLATYCYYGMFNGCTSLTSAPAELPATTLANNCYYYMFYGCTSLTTAPKLPATTLANNCYYYMFQGCASLQTAPALPATTLADYCYNGMFYGCTSLTTAPKLPATTLATYCYYGMFARCSSLTMAPELPATTLANNCYYGMFDNCSSLTTAPELPATTLMEYCYSCMFRNCTSLTSAPELPATTLENCCYISMFQGCSSLNYIKALFTTTPSSSYTSDWVSGVAPTGTFVKSVDATWDVVGNNGVPTGWLVQKGTNDAKDNLAYLTFYCDEAGTIGWQCSNASIARTIQYSKDFGATWTDLTSTTSGATVSVNAGDIVWFKGSNAVYENNNFTLSNKTHVYGNVNSLTGNNTSVSERCFFRLFYNCSNLYTYEHKKIILPATTLALRCYEGMFYGCTSLMTAPELPATTLASRCYYSMFQGCNSLTSAPALPATTLAQNCYERMFRNCTSLTSAPALPATTLATYCYASMFQGCTSLTSAPMLPATTLADYCYSSMFQHCTSLTTAPELPATTLADYCYSNMFNDCTSLITAPALPVTTLANNCYGGMFMYCSSLTTAPELPATTLADSCYNCMFFGCTSLTTVPELPATTLISNCYIYMFRGCTSLNYIKALFTTTPSDNYTQGWVQDVAPTGTFVKSAAATWDVTGVNGVPTGWTVMTEREAYLANGHAFVDLGLRSNGNKILFATMNVGASSPEEYGDYFAWGETSKRYTSISGDSVVGGSFELSNCPYHTGSTYNTGWSKYIPTGKESYTVSGTADNKLTLEARDDVASVLWGGNWRMPDKSDLEYLISSNVTYSWTDNYNGTGVRGSIITGKGSFSSASLFLPAAGNCYDTDRLDAEAECQYWSRSVYSDTPKNASKLYSSDSFPNMTFNGRCTGLSVRPVLVIPE